ncbi:MAG: DUF3791 domain-containing protein [Ruminobacter sp.]|nr:DUF3791 domain-containing protein [Ruminobacter sp.]MDY5779804.1 DUF3791 domain-containing protein [Succinivibrionaceae bacterium]
MNAHPILLQKKYTRIVALFAKKNHLTLPKALDLFYRSQLYVLIRKGVSDLHCMSDEYLVEELEDEVKNKSIN